MAVMALSTVHAELPEVELKDTDGHVINTAHLCVKGKPIIISFFATWCKPCMRELKAINEVYEDWQDETGVKMYIISIDQGQDIKKVKPLVDGNDWDFHVLLDPNGEFKRAMNVVNVPHTFVLDPKGQIVYNHPGYTDGSEKEIYDILRSIKH